MQTSSIHISPDPAAHYLLRHPVMWFALCLPAAINHYYSRPAELWRAQRRAERRRTRDVAAA